VWVAVSVPFIAAYGGFLRDVSATWVNDPESAYGLLVPLIVGYLVWLRRGQLAQVEHTSWLRGLALVIASCCLQTIASLSGSLVLSGLAFVASVMGMVGFLYGRQILSVLAAPLVLLILMVPLPSYVTGELSWYLQSRASTVSSVLLRTIGVPVYQDGNLLKLPSYVLEVKQACSGSRSIFALLAVALLLGLGAGQRWWVRLLLVLAAPLLALGANTIRIVGTGVIAWQWNTLAANESLHEGWGIFAFLISVLGLLGLQRLLGWVTKEYA
jgi:exosortase